MSESCRVCAQVHPDVNPALRSTDDAVLLNEAYAVLQLVSHLPVQVPKEVGISPFHRDVNAAGTNCTGEGYSVASVRQIGT